MAWMGSSHPRALCQSRRRKMKISIIAGIRSEMGSQHHIHQGQSQSQNIWTPGWPIVESMSERRKAWLTETSLLGQSPMSLQSLGHYQVLILVIEYSRAIFQCFLQQKRLFPNTLMLYWC